MSGFEIVQSIGAFATFGALVVLIIQAGQTKQQLKQTRDQVELTREQMKFVARETRYNFRPWIYRENFDEYTPLKVKFDGNAKQIKVHLKFKNYGKLAPISKHVFINLDSRHITDLHK